MIFKRKTIRKFWLNLHLSIALSVGFIFVILGLSGSFNVFHWELEELGLPEVKHERNAQPLDLDALMERIHHRHPQKNGRWLLFMPGYERDYLWVVYPKPEEKVGKFFTPLRLQINPYSGEIAGGHYWGDSLWTLVYSLHASLLTEPFFGAEISRKAFDAICFLGVLLMLSVGSGLYLWWPSPGKICQALVIKPRASLPRFIYDLHKVTGAYFLVILFVLAFTGFSFAYKDYLMPLVSPFTKVEALHFHDPENLSSRAGTTHPTKPAISIMQAVAIADRVFPYGELRWLATPDGPGGVYAIEKRQAGEANRRRPRSKVWIDQYSGEILAVEDPQLFSAGETFFNLMWPLHNGEAFGLPGRVLWCMTGLAPLILYVTGIMRWLQKRKAAKIKHRSPDGA
ncbi:PepSY-associated TM helix domain-containing protein [Methylotuvimicrobium sp. KM2]|uniref:PepSY-associated TM helix domain-containing protein n=1 Tax=Methylotuvimicrobium sp. KM2 TaxID=3133976 RepID=UPI0031018988